MRKVWLKRRWKYLKEVEDNISIMNRILDKDIKQELEEYLFVPGTINTPTEYTKEVLDKTDRGEDLIEYKSFEDFEKAFFDIEDD